MSTQTCYHPTGNSSLTTCLDGGTGESSTATDGGSSAKDSDVTSVGCERKPLFRYQPQTLLPRCRFLLPLSKRRYIYQWIIICLETFSL